MLGKQVKSGSLNVYTELLSSIWSNRLFIKKTCLSRIRFVKNVFDMSIEHRTGHKICRYMYNTVVINQMNRCLSVDTQRVLQAPAEYYKRNIGANIVFDHRQRLELYKRN